MPPFSTPLLSDLLFWQSPDRFYLESPSQQGTDRRILVIDR